MIAEEHLLVVRLLEPPSETNCIALVVGFGAPTHVVRVEYPMRMADRSSVALRERAIARHAERKGWT